MLKRTIKYVDFDDVEQEDIYYFNLNQSELMELEAGAEGVSFSSRMERIVEAKDVATIIEEIKKLILLSYGEKSLDGKTFVKNDEIRQQFSQTAAFDALFVELSQDAGAAIEFLKGALPKAMSESFDKAVSAEEASPKVQSNVSPQIRTNVSTPQEQGRKE